MNIKKIIGSIAVLGLVFAITAQAASFRLPKGHDNIVGKMKWVNSRYGDTLADIGRRYDIGHYEMLVANPRIPASHRFTKRTKVLVPSMFILPGDIREGIVINLAELRLYYYPPGENRVITEPVGIGREGGWETPTGKTRIIEKTKDPVWRPTANVRADTLKRYGKVLPTVVPAGPKNPLGTRAMRLGWGEYLIHGTNHPRGVGQRSSAGCIRMFKEDVEDLFDLVEVGTPVRVIHEPFKLGRKRGHLYLESHKPLIEKREAKTRQRVPVVKEIYQHTANLQYAAVDWVKVRHTLHQHTGVPQPILKYRRG